MNFLENFDKILSPLNLFAKILNVPPHGPKPARIKITKIISSIIILLSYTICMINTAKFSIQMKKSPLSRSPLFFKKLYLIKTHIEWISVLTIVFLHYANYNKVNNFLFRMKRLDFNILMSFGKVLHRPKYNQIKRQIIILLLLVEMLLFYIPARGFYQFGWSFLNIVCSHILVHQMEIFVYGQCGLYGYLLKKRFASCNELLTKLLVQRQPKFGYTIIVESRTRSRQIKFLDISTICDSIFEIHNECYELSYDLNKLYGLQILLIVATGFFDTLWFSNTFLYNYIGIDANFFSLGILLAFSVLKLVFITKILGDTASVGNYTKIILQRARINVPELKNHVSKVSKFLVEKQCDFVELTSQTSYPKNTIADYTTLDVSK